MRLNIGGYGLGEYGNYGGPDYGPVEVSYNEKTGEYYYTLGAGPKDGLDEVYMNHDIAYGLTELKLQRGDITETEARLEIMAADRQLIKDSLAYNPFLDQRCENEAYAEAFKSAAITAFTGKMAYDMAQLVKAGVSDVIAEGAALMQDIMESAGSVITDIIGTGYDFGSSGFSAGSGSDTGGTGSGGGDMGDFDADYACGFGGGWSSDWDGGVGAAGGVTIPCDPLLIDLNSDGIQTTSLTSGTFFDYDGNGFAERMGWASSDDGILVLDRNNDGIINDGSELFGDQTLLSTGKRAANGFQALADLDSNADGKIDVNDISYSQLRIWQDTDSDGYSQESELFTLDALGISSINLTATAANITDASGNTQTLAGTFTKTDGTIGEIADYNLQIDSTYSIPAAWVTIPEDIAALPDLQGYGNVYKLRQKLKYQYTWRRFLGEENMRRVA